jgi:uncharacterized NAD-dependent epimerase/dehydratase family protein
MPDAFILCHQPTRLKDDYGYTLPSLKYAVEMHETVMRHFKEAKVVGVGLNSIGLNDDESLEAAEQIERETGLPAVDTFRFGAAKLADVLLKYFGKG